MAIRSGVTITKDHVREVAEQMKRFVDTRVMVGFPQETTARDAGEPITNAALGYIHNYGAPEANIPQREFMEPSLRKKQQEITDFILLAAQEAMAIPPDWEKVQKAWHRLGLFAQAALKSGIVNGNFIPLAKATLEARRRRGVERTKPLIDTAAMLNAITYVIRRVSTGQDVAVGPTQKST
jgi:hypothetical protein